MKKLLKILGILIFIAILLAFGINFYVKQSVKDRIIADDEYAQAEGADCIIVLGAGVVDGHPSLTLADRLSKGIELYKSNISGKFIMTGDHGQVGYDEVNIMKEYAIDQGIPSEDIFMDHAGFSTYDSIYRAKYIFKADKVVIVSQKYHLYRALYIAKRLGLDAYGVCAADVNYTGAAFNRGIREVLARDKDFMKAFFKPEPKYLGEEIPVSGDGDVTND